jgi:FkbM family methyltransferase
MATYSLIEQGDWFEDEIQFVKTLLQSDSFVIDIGANFGVYTIAMANTIGNGGRVVSFEPSSKTFGALSESIELNSFKNVTLIRKGLSSNEGTASFAIGSDPTLSSLSEARNPDFKGETETIDITTLDMCMAKYGWENIDFIKIDAEGEEVNIINGGVEFFKNNSPLIMIEGWIGKTHSLLIDLGYQSYRLVPGLSLLVPLAEGEDHDPYVFNFFLCKPDRAIRLSENGKLVLAMELTNSEAFLKEKVFSHAELVDSMSKMPYAVHFENLLWINRSQFEDVNVRRAICLAKISEDANYSMADRFLFLQSAFNCASDFCSIDSGKLRLATLARIALAYGKRGVAVRSLAELTNNILSSNVILIEEPFLLPNNCYDEIAVHNFQPAILLNWLLFTFLATLEKIEHFSSYFTGDANLVRLETIKRLSFEDAEIDRRIDLIKRVKLLG